MTAEQILAEIQELANKAHQADGYATMDELFQAAEVSAYTVRKMVKEAKRAGRLDVRRVPRPNVEGAIQHVVGYRILPP